MSTPCAPFKNIFPPFCLGLLRPEVLHKTTVLKTASKYITPEEDIELSSISEKLCTIN
jgi:hypothetical protein